MSRPHRFVLIAIALLCVPAACAAADVAIGDSGYVVTVPANLQAMPPGDAAVKLANGDGTLQFQVSYIQGEATINEVADGYHKGLASNMPDIKLAGQSWEAVGGDQGLYRHYTTKVDGVDVNIQALLFSKNNKTFIVQAVSHGQDLAGLKRCVASLRPGAAPPAVQPPTVHQPPDTTPAATSAVAIGNSGYQLSVPSEFSARNNPDVVLHLANQADNALIQAVIVPDDATLDQLVQRYEAKMTAGMQAFSRKAIMEPVVDGVPARLITYGASAEGEAVDIQAIFFVKGNTRLMVHALSQKRPLPPLRNVLLSLSRGGQSAPVGPAPTPTPQATTGWRLHIETDANFQLQVPADWTSMNSATRDTVTFRGPEGGRFEVTTINLQMLGKAHAEHRDLATSLKELHKQIDAGTDGAVLAEDSGKLAGRRDVRKVDYRMRIDGQMFRFRMFLVDLDQMVLWVSFVAPQDQFDRIEPIADHVASTMAILGGGR